MNNILFTEVESVIDCYCFKVESTEPVVFIQSIHCIFKRRGSAVCHKGIMAERSLTFDQS